MEDLTKTQLILLVLLVSFVTSLTTVVVTISLLQQFSNPSPQTILQRVIEKVSDDDENENQVSNISKISQEDTIIKVAQEASPAVVSIIATKDLPTIEHFFFAPFQLRQFSGGDTKKQEVGRGTGFFVTADGYIISNRHVVADTEASYTVLTNRGNRYNATVLARDPIHDIAILKVDGKNFPTIPLGNSDVVKIGQTVIAIGNALGEFQNTVSTGIISGAERTVVASGGTIGPEALQRVFQTDAAINPGNSGGPLLNSRGEVIGINTAIISGAENIGFAVPSNLASRDLKQVRSSGRITYAFLGVRYVPITQTLKEEQDLSVNYGVMLLSRQQGSPAIVPNSPAELAGLQEHDIILSIDNQRIDEYYTLAEAIQSYAVGDTITLQILRGMQELKFSITLTELP